MGGCPGIYRSVEGSYDCRNYDFMLWHNYNILTHNYNMVSRNHEIVCWCYSSRSLQQGQKSNQGQTMIFRAVLPVTDPTQYKLSVPHSFRDMT